MILTLYPLERPLDGYFEQNLAKWPRIGANQGHDPQTQKKGHFRSIPINPKGIPKLGYSMHPIYNIEKG